MQTLRFLISMVAEIYSMVLLLRVWMQWARCDFYNPLSQFVVRITQRVVSPLRRVIPSIGAIDSASVLLVLVLCIFKASLVLGVVGGSILSILPTILVFALFTLLKNLGLLIFWVLLIMAVMSWISQGRNPVEYVLIQMVEPLLRPIRRWLPSMGGIDLSPMIFVLLLYVINMGISEMLASLDAPGWSLLWRIA